MANTIYRHRATDVPILRSLRNWLRQAWIDRSCELSATAKLAAVLTDHQPRLTRERGNLTRCPQRKSPVELLDHSVDGAPVLFLDARHAPKATSALCVAFGFGDGDRLLVFADPVINNVAALGEQTQKVLGLALIRRLRSRAFDIGGGAARGQRGHGA